MRRGILFLLWCCIILLPSQSDTISFTANTMHAELAEGRERTILDGAARLNTEDIEIFADSIELYGEDLIFALCTGSIRVVNEKEQWELVSNNLFFNRRDDIIRIQGNSQMEDRKNEMVIKGGLIEIRNKEDLVIIQVGVRILKDDLACRSQMALYYREEERLELTGLPYVLWKDDEYRATKIFVDLETDEVQLEGDVQAEVSYEEEEETDQQGEP